MKKTKDKNRNLKNLFDDKKDFPEQFNELFPNSDLNLDEWLSNQPPIDLNDLPQIDSNELEEMLSRFPPIDFDDPSSLSDE